METVTASALFISCENRCFLRTCNRDTFSDRFWRLPLLRIHFIAVKKREKKNLREQLPAKCINFYVNMFTGCGKVSIWKISVRWKCAFWWNICMFFVKRFIFVNECFIQIALGNKWTNFARRHFLENTMEVRNCNYIWINRCSASVKEQWTQKSRMNLNVSSFRSCIQKCTQLSLRIKK